MEIRKLIMAITIVLVGLTLLKIFVNEHSSVEDNVELGIESGHIALESLDLDFLLNVALL